MNHQFTIQNTGEYDGDEVILIYINDIISRVTTPVKKLVHFQRIHLQKDERTELKITIINKHFGLYNANMEYIIEPGTFEIIVGNNILNEEVEMVEF